MATNLRKASHKIVIGNGAPANGDDLSLHRREFKIGTLYIDDTNNVIYSRTAKNQVAADWDLLSGEGGGSSYLVASVELTDAQIKALPTTGIEIIAAQGSGKGIIVISGLAKLNSSGGAYGNVTANALIIQGSTMPFNVKQLQFLGVGLDDSAGVYYGYSSPFNDTNYAPPDQIDNVGISIKSQNTGDFTGGNAANILEVTIYYVVVDL